jgi:inward rectifier potassium channel
MFRIINTRDNQLVNLEITVSLSRLEPKPDGTLYRRYYGLNLERNKVAFFPANWTLVHPITEKSPFYGCTPEELEQSDTELLISLQALDDTFVQSVHTRFSYRYDEILWGHKFRPIYTDEHQTRIDLDKLDETEEVELN